MSLQNKYVIVRSNSTSGPYIIERNEAAPKRNAWTKADVAGYASTIKEAERIASNANRTEGYMNNEEELRLCIIEIDSVIAAIETDLTNGQLAEAQDLLKRTRGALHETRVALEEADSPDDVALNHLRDALHKTLMQIDRVQRFPRRR